jgi:hypothetical protein
MSMPSFESNTPSPTFGEMPKPTIDKQYSGYGLHESYEGPAVADIAVDHEQGNPLPRLEAVAPILGKASFFLAEY